MAAERKVQYSAPAVAPSPRETGGVVHQVKLGSSAMPRLMVNSKLVFQLSSRVRLRARRESARTRRGGGETHRSNSATCAVNPSASPASNASVIPLRNWHSRVVAKEGSALV